MRSEDELLAQWEEYKALERLRKSRRGKPRTEVRERLSHNQDHGYAVQQEADNRQRANNPP
jgi:hypothetical protein